MVAVAVLGAVGVGVAVAAFSGTTTNAANTFSAAPDFVPPSATSVIERNGGSVPGYVKQGGTYYLYANITDTGNPASGLASATADVSAVTSGQTASGVTTTGGPWTVGGTSYSRRSTAAVTASNPLSEGAKMYTLTMADNASNSQTQNGFSVTVDNTQPSASDIQGVPGGTAGAIDTGDKLVFAYSEAIDPTTIKANWDGTSTAITVSIDTANPGTLTTNVNLGSVNLGQKAYTSSGATFNATLTMAGAAVTVTLGTETSGGASRSMTAASLVWTPSASALDPAGNASTTTARTETGASDADF